MSIAERLQEALPEFLGRELKTEEKESLRKILVMPHMQAALAQIYRIHTEVAVMALRLDMGSEKGIYEMAKQQGRAEGLLQCIDYLIRLAEEEEENA